jgi:hypothetical protein
MIGTEEKPVSEVGAGLSWAAALVTPAVCAAGSLDAAN